MAVNGDSGAREHWGSNLGFVLAAAGSAIGLGNIWKFPYITGENGGGAFVLVYLVCILVVGLPVMLCEISLGRHTQRNPVGAFKALCPESSMVAHGLGAAMILTSVFLCVFQQWGLGVVLLGVGVSIFLFSWRVVGAMGVIAGFVILSFYSVVAGWTLGYIVQCLQGKVTQLPPGTLDPGAAATLQQLAKHAESHFVQFAQSAAWGIGCHFVFMTLCVLIVIRGIRAGIEQWSRILMPLLFVLLILLIIRGVTLPGATEGIRFLLSPDRSKLTAEGVLLALGHAFFTLSLGMGAMITYGSYMSKEQNIFIAGLSITFLDTLIALMAGLAIFPAVFAAGADPSAGPGLVFVTLPSVFGTIPGGQIWAALFFTLLAVAALTSGISLLEVVTAYFVDEKGWCRTRVTVISGIVIFLMGVPCALSCLDWDRLPGLHQAVVAAFHTEAPSFLDVLDIVSSNYLLPLGGLFISLFVGWIWGTRKAVEEIRHGSHNFADVHLFSLLAGLKDDPSHNSEVHVITLASLWGIFIRFITPVAVMIAFLHKVGWLKL